LWWANAFHNHVLAAVLLMCRDQWDDGSRPVAAWKETYAVASSVQEHVDVTSSGLVACHWHRPIHKMPSFSKEVKRAAGNGKMYGAANEHSMSE
jgi:hypothetical protein